jgi:hypothetical protein
MSRLSEVLVQNRAADVCRWDSTASTPKDGGNSQVNEYGFARIILKTSPQNPVVDLAVPFFTTS